MDKEESKIDVRAESLKTRRSERNLKRNVRLSSLPKVLRKLPKEKISKTVHKNIKKVSIQPSRELPVKQKSEKRVNASMHAKEKRKREKKSLSYEIDCSNINMDTTEFRKDLWNRALNGKLNDAKNVQIKQRENTILIKTRSYVSKKCVRSNIHFLIMMYLKQRKLERSVHVVGNGTTYKLMYK